MPDESSMTIEEMTAKVNDVLARANKESAEAAEVNEPGIAAGLTVEHILSEIAAAPSSRAASIAAGYAGKKVKWNGVYHALTKDRVDKERVRVVCRTSMDGRPSFNFSTAMNELPQLKDLRIGSVFSVLGTIEKAGGEDLSVTLKPLRIEILYAHTARIKPQKRPAAGAAD